MNTESFAGTKFGHLFVKVLAAGMESRFRHRFFPPERILQGVDMSPGQTVLEVGCGNGYYSEVFAHFLGDRVAYAGVDYSEAMISRALTAYPGGDFKVGDATALNCADSSFDIVYNGVSLLHILDYERAVAESRRVAREACVFHTVPVFRERPTAYLHKYAYGGSVVEIVFNRFDLLACFSRQGLIVDRTWLGIPYDVSHVAGERSFTETFLCRPK